MERAIFFNKITLGKAITEFGFIPSKEISRIFVGKFGGFGKEKSFPIRWLDHAWSLGRKLKVTLLYNFFCYNEIAVFIVAENRASRKKMFDKNFFQL